MGPLTFLTLKAYISNFTTTLLEGLVRIGRRKRKERKYNIQPVQREFLSGLDAYLCLRGNESLEEQVREGLRQGGRSLCEGRARYGIPFLGDNNFMIDVLREEPILGPAFWYRRLTGEVGPLKFGALSTDCMD